MGEACWRIDELAQRAGLTVDTIRYYSREGLLQAPVKQGRNRLYDQAHLDRLERIGELRSQRFSLAAIRAVVADLNAKVMRKIGSSRVAAKRASGTTSCWRRSTGRR